eukprot:500924_1
MLVYQTLTMLIAHRCVSSLWTQGEGSNTLPRGDWMMAVGYDATKDTVLLFGGEDYRRQFVTFKNNEFTDVNELYLSTAQQSRGHSQYYSQIGNDLWIIPTTGTGFIQIDTETYTVSAPSITIPTTVYDNACLVAIPGYLIVIGGGGVVSPFPLVQIYMFQYSSWLTGVPSLPSDRMGATCEVVNDKLYVIGGLVGGFAGGTEVDSIVTLDISPLPTTTGLSWATLSGKLSTPRWILRSVVDGTDIYVIGGAITDGNVWLGDVQVIDTVSGTCQVVDTLVSAAVGPACIFVDDAVIYALGGSYDPGPPLVGDDRYQYTLLHPTRRPTTKPTNPTTSDPTRNPTSNPTNPTTSDPTTSADPTFDPTRNPTRNPSVSPTENPTLRPITSNPIKYPTSNPTTSDPITSDPTRNPTTNPTTSNPTRKPTTNPITSEETRNPTANPLTSDPTRKSTKNPSVSPTENIITSSSNPTLSPTTFDQTFAPTKETTVNYHVSSTQTTVLENDIPPNVNHRGIQLQLLIFAIILGILVCCCFDTCLCYKYFKHKKKKKIENSMSNIQMRNAHEMHAISSIDNDFGREMLASWLRFTVQLPQYIHLFISQGYDTMQAAQSIESEDDLRAIGIKHRSHQRLILVEIEKLQQTDFVAKGITHGINVIANKPTATYRSGDSDSDNSQSNPNGCERELVVSWIRFTVQLPRYIDLFISQGYDTMQSIQSISGKDDLRALGIKRKTHQTLILTEIEKLRGTDFVVKGITYGADVITAEEYQQGNETKNNALGLPTPDTDMLDDSDSDLQKGENHQDYWTIEGQ